MDIEINMKFQCPKCNSIIHHDYTQKDLLNQTYLDLTCQECNYYEQIKTSILIEKAKQEAINEIKKNFETV